MSTTTTTHWTVSHGMSGYLPMNEDVYAFTSWTEARDALIADMRDYADTDDDMPTMLATDYPQHEDGSPYYGDDMPTMLATVNSMVRDGDVAPIEGAEWTGWVEDGDGRTIYFSLTRHESSECDDACEIVGE